MQMILGGINGNYLTNITLSAVDETQEVLAAVAYATEMSLLFDWCWNNSIPLKYFGRLDDGVAVKTSILTQFLERKSALFQCRLVQHHHAKVIWWRGYGLYVGSANLTPSAWYKNVEAGCFFPESEISDEMSDDIFDLFSVLTTNSTLLTKELLGVMQERSKSLLTTKPSSDDFWSSPSFKKWSGLVYTGKTSAALRKKQDFLEEWHSTLQQLRDIGELVSKPSNQPIWVSENAATGAQADQFLHAHYYECTFEDRKARYADHFERNKNDPDAAVEKAINWWRQLPEAPSEEELMLNTTGPALQTLLSDGGLQQMDYQSFREICAGVHSIKDYARQVANRLVGLKIGTSYTVSEKIDALSRRIWETGSTEGHDVKRLLHFILYGGPDAELPERLWLGVDDSRWKIEGLGVSALGELVGWALPEKFPPRNGRTSKSLRSLGFDVKVHVG